MDLQIQGPSPWEGGRSLQLQPSRWEDLRPRWRPPSSSHDGDPVLPPLLPLPLFGVSRHTFQRCYKNSHWTRHSGTLGHAFPESTVGAGSVALLSL